MTNFVAKQFTSPENLEMLGIVLIAFKQNLHEQMTAPIFDKYGLDSEHLKPDTWYPAAIMSDIYHEIYQNGGGSSSLVAMGKASVAAGLEVINPDTIEDFIDSINQPILINLRNYPDGYGWIVEKNGDQHYRITNNTDAPNDLMYGYLWEMLRLLIDADEHFQVLPVRNYQLGSEDGAVYEISWGVD